MGYVTRAWVQAQFQNFADRISSIFAKKTDIQSYSAATQSENGLMTAADKKKLDNIAAGANKTTYTNNLAATVTGTALDAVQGKALDDKGSQMSVYKGDDGNLHFRDWTGADTAIPFNTINNLSAYYVNANNITVDKDYETCIVVISVGIKPDGLIVSFSDKDIISQIICEISGFYAIRQIMRIYIVNNLHKDTTITVSNRYNGGIAIIG